MPGSVERHVQGWCHVPGDPSAPAKPVLYVGHLTAQAQAGGRGPEGRGQGRQGTEVMAAWLRLTGR